MEKRLSSADIPDTIMADIRDAFDRDQKVMEMRTHQNLLMRSGKYREALKVGYQIDFLFTKVVQAYITEANTECEQITLDKAGLPQEDAEQLNECVVTIFMCCDIIETAIMDANDILHKTDKGLHFEMFNELTRLSRFVKEKMQYMRDNSAYAADVAWADKCDNMYQLLRNKARSVIRKRKTDPNWGK